MPLYTKESLENLRQRVVLADLISQYIELKPSGSTLKGLCPFHDEKTPSFGVQKGDTHYHCFGCGAHGDAIQFLMAYQKLSFTDAVEILAEKFHVPLEVAEGQSEYKGPSKKLLKEAMQKAARFFHFYLLHTPEGHQAAEYLRQRGISIDFIRRFTIGLAPKNQGILRQILAEQEVSDLIMETCGLIVPKAPQGFHDFFRDRITFPIHDPSGLVIGFSARKYKDETFGGKYINTSETPIFKKSRVLFGLNHSRRQIAKERRAIIVEGQIDALRLIYEGFNYTVASQGTAFGEAHAQELINLGVNEVFLALDSDEAGMEAASKIGNFFQREGVQVNVVSLPVGSDPDSYLREEGKEKFSQLMETKKNYLDFLVEFYARETNIDTPAGKNKLAATLVKQIRGWKHSLMIHESLKRLALLLQIPEHLILSGQEYMSNIHIRKSANIGQQTINPIRILESDLLRWLILVAPQKPSLIRIAEANIQGPHLQDPTCKRLYESYLQQVHTQIPCDLLSLMQQEEDQAFLAEILEKKVNLERAEEHLVETIQKILDRNWMEMREEIKRKIQSGRCSDDEALQLLKEFNELKQNPPKVILPVQHFTPSITP